MIPVAYFNDRGDPPGDPIARWDHDVSLEQLNRGESVAWCADDGCYHRKTPGRQYRHCPIHQAKDEEVPDDAA